MAVKLADLLSESHSCGPVVSCRACHLVTLTRYDRTQVVDYYGVALCLCGIIVATDMKSVRETGESEGCGISAASIVWCLGVLILGSPVACVYMIWRISKGSIALQGNDRDFYIAH
jgi:hypothetical protein